MLVSNNEEKIKKVRFWATQARDQARHYQHSELGFNYRMSNIVAGIGRGQLKVLDQRVAKKRYIFDFYKRELGGLEDVQFMPINEWNEPNCWLSCITLSGKVRPLDIMEALEKENIESRPIWKPMHMQPLFADSISFPHYDDSYVGEEVFARALCLPSGDGMKEEQIDFVVTELKNCFAK